MASIALRRDDVIVGVDTHKDQHVAVVLDGLGGRVDDLFIPATRPATPSSWRSVKVTSARTGNSLPSVSRAPAPTASAWPGSCDATVTRSTRSTGHPARASVDCRARATPSTPNTRPARCSPVPEWRSRRPLTGRSRQSG